MYKLKERPKDHVISGILIVVNIVRHYLMKRLEECPTAHVINSTSKYSAGLLYEYDIMFTE